MTPKGPKMIPKAPKMILQGFQNSHQGVAACKPSHFKGRWGAAHRTTTHHSTTQRDHIQHGAPRGAGGASKAVYQWLDQMQAPAFPEEVVAVPPAPGPKKKAKVKTTAN